MFEVWKIEKKGPEETQVNRLDDAASMEAALQIANSTGPGTYRVCDGFGPILTLKLHATHAALKPQRS